MSWIAEYDTQGREFPTCVHVTKTAGTMTHGVTYVPIEDGKAVRAENAKLRELARLLLWGVDNDMPRYEELAWSQRVNTLVGELGIEVCV